VASVLGISPDAAREWADDVAQRFHLYFSSKQVSRSETETGYQLQRLAGLFQQRDNDYFARLYYSNRRDLQNPLQLQFLDADQIGDGYGWTSTYGELLAKDGIVRDAAGREIAYKVRVQNRDQSYKWVTVPAMGARSGRKFMIHGYRAEYPGQGRGFARFAHAIQEFENLTDFTSAQIKKAINQANLTMYVKPSPDNVASNPMENLVTQHAGPASAEYGATPSTTTSALPLDEMVKYVPLPEATDRIPGSVGVFNLQKGEDIKPFESSAPADSYDCTTRVCSQTGRGGSPPGSDKHSPLRMSLRAQSRRNPQLGPVSAPYAGHWPRTPSAPCGFSSEANGSPAGCSANTT